MISEANELITKKLIGAMDLFIAPFFIPRLCYGLLNNLVHNIEIVFYKYKLES